MAVISGYAELAAESGEVPERRQYAGTIVNQVEQMNQMILNLLAFVRGESNLELSSVPLRDLGQRALEMLRPLAEPAGVVVDLQVEPGCAVLDSNRTDRIIYNLGKNALEAAGRGGRVEISLRPRDGGLELRVTDSGPGIPAELQRDLFQPFRTHGKRGGTGLGLAIVKRFAEDQGGSVSFESAPGTGTTFSVFLPGKDPVSTEAGPAAPG